MSFSSSISSPSLKIILTLGNSSKKREREGEVIARDDKEKVQKLDEVQSLQDHKIDHASLMPFDVWRKVFTYLKPEDLYKSKILKAFEYDKENDTYYAEKKQKGSLETISLLFNFYLKEFKKDPYWKYQCRESFRETVLSLPIQRKSEINWYDFYRQELLKHKYLISNILQENELPVGFKDDSIEESLEIVKSVEGYLYYLTDNKLIIKQMNFEDLKNSMCLTINLPEKYKNYGFEDIYIDDKKIYLIAKKIDEQLGKKTSVFEYNKEILLQSIAIDGKAKHSIIDSEENEYGDLKRNINDPIEIYDLPLNVVFIYRQSNLLICEICEATDSIYIIDFENKNEFTFPKLSHLVYVTINENQLVLWNVYSNSFIKIDTKEIINFDFKESNVELKPFAHKSHQNIFVTYTERKVSEYKEEEGEINDSEHSLSLSMDSDEHLVYSEDMANFTVPLTPTTREVDRTFIDIYDSATLNRIYQISFDISPNEMDTIVYDNKLYCFKGAQLIHVVDLFSKIKLVFETNFEEIKKKLENGRLVNFNLVDGLYFFSNNSESFVFDLRATQYYLIPSECQFNQHTFSTKHLARMENYLLVGENCQSKRMNYVEINLPVVDPNAEELPDTQPYEGEE